LATLRRKIEYRERTTCGFHYSELSTEEYRRKYGYLDYRCRPQSIPAVRDPEDVRMNRDRRILVPDEIWRAGQVNLTGLIHPQASHPNIWAYLSQRMPRFAEAAWTEQMGGKETFFRLVELAKRYYELPSSEAVSYRRELELMVNPERERQRGFMRAAVERVLQLVYL